MCGPYGPHYHLTPTLQTVSYSLPEDLSTPKYFLGSSFRDCHTELPFDWRDAACKPTTKFGAFCGEREEGLPLCELIYQRGISVGRKQTCEICEDVLQSRIDLRNVSGGDVI